MAWATAHCSRTWRSVGGGKYFRVNSSVGGGEQIADALDDIFSEIQAVNSVFASVSLPVSVNTQGTYLNQIYIGMFRPDQDGHPRWVGNLKQYKLGSSATAWRPWMPTIPSAINASTGFITECARSFWTPTAVDNYWAFRPQGGCLSGGGIQELELLRTATSSRRARRPTCCAARPRARSRRARRVLARAPPIWSISTARTSRRPTGPGCRGHGGAG